MPEPTARGRPARSRRPAATARAVLPLSAAIASRSRREHARAARSSASTPSASRMRAVDRRALDDAAVRREVADGEADRRRQPLRAGALRRADHVVGVDAVRSRRRARSAVPALARPPTRRAARPSVRPPTVRAPPSSRPSRRRWSITSGTPPARKTRTVGWLTGPLGRASTRRGTARFTARQSSTVGRGRPAACAIGGNVDQEVGRAAERGVHEHGVLERVRRQHVGERAAVAPLLVHAPAPCRRRDVQPDRLPRRRERRVRHASARAPRRRPARRGGAEELAAAAGAGARAAAELGRLLERHAPCAKRAPSVCTAPASSPSAGGSVTPPGTITPGSSREGRRAPSSSPAGPCRTWRRRSRPARVGRLRTSRRSTIAASLR